MKKDAKAVCMPIETVYEALLKINMLGEEQEKKKKTKTGKGSIVSTTRGLWATPFKIVKSFLGWYKK